MRMREEWDQWKNERESEIRPSWEWEWDQTQPRSRGEPNWLAPTVEPSLGQSFSQTQKPSGKTPRSPFLSVFPPLPDPVGLSVCLGVGLSVCLSVWVLGCLSACLFSCLSVWLATGQPVCLVAVKTKDWVQLLKSPHQCKCTFTFSTLSLPPWMYFPINFT